MIGASRLRTRKGSGMYQTGRDRLIQILDTALEILIEDGYQALTLREVARRCNIQIGAVSYYYKSRSDLMMDVINHVLVPYADNINSILHEPGMTAEQMDACWNDKQKVADLIATFQKNATADEIEGTPTFIIAGEKVQNQPWEDLKKIIDAKIAEAEKKG